MKTIQVIFPDRFDKPVGGLSFVATKIKNYLSKYYNFTFLGHPQQVEQKDYTPVYFPLNIRHGSLVTIAGQQSYLFESAKGLKPDLIHAFDWSVFMAGHYAAKLHNVPLICSMQLSINKLNSMGIGYASDKTSPDGFWINETHKEIEFLGLNSADKIIHVSNNYSKGFENYKDKSIVIQNGVDFDDLKGDRITLPGNNPIKVVYIGRFALMKNVEALSRTKIPEGIDLIYVGDRDGGELHVFESMINHVKSNDNVFYLGPVFGKTKADLLTSADAVIFPSTHEPFGIVGLEAMATGCILLTSRVDGIADYATQDNSIYCGTTAFTIEQALNTLVGLNQSARDKYIDNGLETVKHFTWERAMKKYKQVYDEFLL